MFTPLLFVALSREAGGSALDAAFRLGTYYLVYLPFFRPSHSRKGTGSVAEAEG